MNLPLRLSSWLALAAAPPPIHYDCTEALQLGDQGFRATDVDIRWHIFLGGDDSVTERVYVSAQAYPGNLELSARGFFDPAARATMYFSAPLSLRKARWLQLGSGAHILPLRRLEHGRSDSPGTSVPAANLSSVLAGRGDLTVTFLDRRGAVLRRVGVPVATISEALAAFPALHRRAREKAANPQALCDQVLLIVD